MNHDMNKQATREVFEERVVGLFQSSQVVRTSLANSRGYGNHEERVEFFCSYIVWSARSRISSSVSPSCHSAAPTLTLTRKFSSGAASFESARRPLLRSITICAPRSLL